MAKPWWLPIPSPLDDPDRIPTGPTPNIEHLPITTRKGRVVYNRKPHLWRDSDILRVAGNVYGGNTKTAVGILEILQRFTIWMMDKIFEVLAREPVDDFLSEMMYHYIHSVLTKFFDKMLQVDKDRISAITTSGGAH